MRELFPGHRFALQNLNTPGETILQFYQDPEIHGMGAEGPSTQEVMRAVIARVRKLDDERPWPGNAEIMSRAQEIIALFEMRALWYKVVRGEIAIENLPVGPDGHLIIRGASDE